jgi:hypothetical protein
MPRSKKSLRNLTQYRDLSDEEFDEAMKTRILRGARNLEYEERIELKLKEFEDDYDLDDLKANDRMTLRHLAQAIITLDDLETFLYELRTSEDGIKPSNISLIDRLSNQMSKLRSDISKFQDDLKIVRKTRKSDKEASVIAYLDSLKRKAKEFYDQRMTFIICPECNMLLATVWTLYDDEEKNKLILKCNRKTENDQICGNIVEIKLSEYVRDGTNVPDVVAESLR